MLSMMEKDLRGNLEKDEETMDVLEIYESPQIMMLKAARKKINGYSSELQHLREKFTEAKNLEIDAYQLVSLSQKELNREYAAKNNDNDVIKSKKKILTEVENKWRETYVNIGKIRAKFRVFAEQRNILEGLEEESILLLLDSVLENRDDGDLYKKKIIKPSNIAQKSETNVHINNLNSRNKDKSIPDLDLELRYFYTNRNYDKGYYVEEREMDKEYSLENIKMKRVRSIMKENSSPRDSERQSVEILISALTESPTQPFSNLKKKELGVISEIKDALTLCSDKTDSIVSERNAPLMLLPSLRYTGELSLYKAKCIPIKAKEVSLSPRRMIKPAYSYNDSQIAFNTIAPHTVLTDKSLKEQFVQVDLDNKGYITLQELEKYLFSLTSNGLANHNRSFILSSLKKKEFNQFDTIGFDEFAYIMSKWAAL